MDASLIARTLFEWYLQGHTGYGCAMIMSDKSAHVDSSQFSVPAMEPSLLPRIDYLDR